MIKNLAIAILVIPLLAIALAIDEWHIDRRRKKMRQDLHSRIRWNNNDNSETLN